MGLGEQGVQLAHLTPTRRQLVRQAAGVGLQAPDGLLGRGERGGVDVPVGVSLGYPALTL